MGIPRLLPYLRERLKIETTRIPLYDPMNHQAKGMARQIIQQIPCQNLYIDANSIIYDSLVDIKINYKLNDLSDHEMNNIPETLIKYTFNHVQRIIRTICPTQRVYVAFDGVAPRAKTSQQRTRRYISAIQTYGTINLTDDEYDSRTNELNQKKEKKYEKNVRQDNDPLDQLFDTANLSPGTEFMWNLSNYFLTHAPILVNSLKDDKNSEETQLEIKISPVTEPGEGEHKIVGAIRKIINTPNFEPTKNSFHFYGNDGDILVLGLFINTLNFTLVKERRDTKNNSKNNILRTDYIDNSTMKFLYFYSIDEIYNNLQNEFENAISLYSELDKNRLLRDYLYLILFVGNDFVHPSPGFKILTDGISILAENYYMYINSSLESLTQSTGSSSLPNIYLTTSDGGINIVNLYIFLSNYILDTNSKNLLTEHNLNIHHSLTPSLIKYSILNATKSQFIFTQPIIEASMFHLENPNLPYDKLSVKKSQILNKVVSEKLYDLKSEENSSISEKDDNSSSPDQIVPPDVIENIEKNIDDPNFLNYVHTEIAEYIRRKYTTTLASGHQKTIELIDTIFNHSANLLFTFFDSNTDLANSIPFNPLKIMSNNYAKSGINRVFSPDSIDDDALTMCREYFRSHIWVMAYYSVGCPSWTWSYPYNSSPDIPLIIAYLKKLITTSIELLNYRETIINSTDQYGSIKNSPNYKNFGKTLKFILKYRFDIPFELGAPPIPAIQLLAIIPPILAKSIIPGDIYKVLLDSTLAKYMETSNVIYHDPSDPPWISILDIPYQDDFFFEKISTLADQFIRDYKESSTHPSLYTVSSSDSTPDLDSSFKSPLSGSSHEIISQYLHLPFVKLFSFSRFLSDFDKIGISIDDLKLYLKENIKYFNISLGDFITFSDINDSYPMGDLIETIFFNNETISFMDDSTFYTSNHSNYLFLLLIHWSIYHFQTSCWDGITSNLDQKEEKYRPLEEKHQKPSQQLSKNRRFRSSFSKFYTHNPSDMIFDQAYFIFLSPLHKAIFSSSKKSRNHNFTIFKHFNSSGINLLEMIREKLDPTSLIQKRDYIITSKMTDPLRYYFNLLNFSKKQGGENNQQSSGNQNNQRFSGNQNNQRFSGNQNNQRSLGNQNNQRSLGNQNNQRSLGNQNNQRSLGSQNNQRSSGNQNNQRSSGNQNNQRSSGSQNSQRSSRSFSSKQSSRTLAHQRFSGSLDSHQFRNLAQTNFNVFTSRKLSSNHPPSNRSQKAEKFTSNSSNDSDKTPPFNFD